MPTRRAVVAYAEALKRAPDFWEAHCNLVQFYEQLGRRVDAIRHCASAKRLGTVIERCRRISNLLGAYERCLLPAPPSG